jgi:hypothetical protein
MRLPLLADRANPSVENFQNVRSSSMMSFLNRCVDGVAFRARAKPTKAMLELVLLPGAQADDKEKRPRLFHPEWLYCSVRNASDQPMFVYGPRHQSESTTIPTSLFVLKPYQHTPKAWDCKGVLIPRGALAQVGRVQLFGPVALKYRDLRRITVGFADGIYKCPPSNGILTADQKAFPVPELRYHELLDCPRILVAVG